MSQRAANSERSAVKAPVRGTQTFVGVMGTVWNRPSLTGLETGWRWLAGGVVLALGWLTLGKYGDGFAAVVTAVQVSTVFQPVAAVHNLQAATESLLLSIAPLLRWLTALAAVLWLVFSTLGRTVVLRRLDPSLRARQWTFLALTAFRATLLAAVWLLWLWAIGCTARVTITAPASRGAEPSVVLFCAVLIVATLALYVFWAVVSWPLQLAPLLAMGSGSSVSGSLRSAFGCRRELRSKLIETNLVMCIVRLALIVLAMVLSASPLAFQTVATRQFFVLWWTFAVLLYLAASDYFHVVRMADYLKLLQVYKLPSSS